MDDISLEYRVERAPRKKDLMIRVGVIAAAVLFAVLTVIMNMLFILPFLGCLAAGYYFIPRLRVEYEYLFVAGELSVDCIFDRKSRKKLANYVLNEVELLAEEGSEALAAYNNRDLRRRDFTSGRPEGSRLVLITRGNGATEYALLEPGAAITELLHSRYPSKFPRRSAM